VDQRSRTQPANWPNRAGFGSALLLRAHPSAHGWQWQNWAPAFGTFAAARRLPIGQFIIIKKMGINWIKGQKILRYLMGRKSNVFKGNQGC
jgi:hypothetical protein